MICTKCNQELSLSSFDKDKQKASWYRRICKSCRKKESNIYYKKNSHKILSKNKERYFNNKDTYNKWYKNYQKSEKYKAARSYNYLRIKETDDWSINYESLNSLKLKQDNKCAICSCDLLWSGTNKAELDHIYPVSKWWEHIISNVQWTCRLCNRKKNCYIL